MLSMLAALAILAQNEAWADIVLANGDHAGSVVSEGVTYGWFIEDSESARIFRNELDKMVARKNRQSESRSSGPDFVVFIVASAISNDRILNRDHFSFLTDRQIDELEFGGLGAENCSPITTATSDFQVLTFVTIEIEGKLGRDEREQRLTECVRKVFGLIE